mmetsp:Transcript_7115/g.17079  ORF Transcript_7115/g.17079 Transcript_7115/m.17079 type:complete len:619 (+) Transcript_7115:2300-4156(+)
MLSQLCVCSCRPQAMVEGPNRAVPQRGVDSEARDETQNVPEAAGGSSMNRGELPSAPSSFPQPHQGIPHMVAVGQIPPRPSAPLQGVPAMQHAIHVLPPGLQPSQQLILQHQLYQMQISQQARAHGQQGPQHPQQQQPRGPAFIGLQSMPMPIAIPAFAASASQAMHGQGGQESNASAPTVAAPPLSGAAHLPLMFHGHPSMPIPQHLLHPQIPAFSQPVAVPPPPPSPPQAQSSPKGTAGTAAVDGSAEGLNGQREPPNPSQKEVKQPADAGLPQGPRGPSQKESRQPSNSAHSRKRSERPPPAPSTDNPARGSHSGRDSKSMNNRRRGGRDTQGKHTMSDSEAAVEQQQPHQAGKEEARQKDHEGSKPRRMSVPRQRRGDRQLEFSGQQNQRSQKPIQKPDEDLGSGKKVSRDFPQVKEKHPMTSQGQPVSRDPRQQESSRRQGQRQGQGQHDRAKGGKPEPGAPPGLESGSALTQGAVDQDQQQAKGGRAARGGRGGSRPARNSSGGRQAPRGPPGAGDELLSRGKDVNARGEHQRGPPPSSREEPGGDENPAGNRPAAQEQRAPEGKNPGGSRSGRQSRRGSGRMGGPSQPRGRQAPAKSSREGEGMAQAQGVN